MSFMQSLSKQSDQSGTATCLRLGLAFVFMYAGIESLAHPDNWIGYLPHVLTNVIHASLLLRLLSIYQLGLAAWLLSGTYIRVAAGLSLLTLAGITFANLSLFDITFRDVGLTFMAAALLFY